MYDISAGILLYHDALIISIIKPKIARPAPAVCDTKFAISSPLDSIFLSVFLVFS